MSGGKDVDLAFRLCLVAAIWETPDAENPDLLKEYREAAIRRRDHHIANAIGWASR